MWQYGHSRLSMFVVDALVPIWHQDICNHCDHGARSVYIRRVEHNIWHLQDTMGRLHYSMAHSVLSWWSVNYIKSSAAPYIYRYIYIYTHTFAPHMHVFIDSLLSFYSHAIDYQSDNFRHRYCGPFGKSTLVRITKLNKSLQHCSLQKFAFINFPKYDAISELFSDLQPGAIAGVSCVKQNVKFNSIKWVNHSVPTSIWFSSAWNGGCHVNWWP